jgi:biopolymer transport protein ExbB
MAGGVSKATLPTMAGMVVLFQGSFASIYLIVLASDRHETSLRELIKREL